MILGLNKSRYHVPFQLIVIALSLFGESIPLLAMAVEPRRELPISMEQLDTSMMDGAKFVNGETSLQLLIDQEGFRDPKVDFLQTAPHLRRLHLNGNDSIDYLRREASLTIGTKSGVYRVSSHSKVDLDLAQVGKDIEGPYFCFAYETNARLNLVGRPMKGERLLRPLVFVCSREFLNPNQGRKVSSSQFKL
ncbi:uncharacterized protein JCM6883_006238, partial [Sporobolomyces salmoneus]|uniref:uncharacterized protein n=1 Tax=Sporobolomyces salmoneus TaxID=183962 RepID=UPI003176F242